MTYKSNPERYLDRPTIERIEKIAAFFSPKTDTYIIENLPIYAIGDIHGMDRYLLKLLGFILKDAKNKNICPARFIFLGDYVDRGTGVAETLAIIRLLQELMPKDFVIALRGNHEQMFIEDYIVNYEKPEFSQYSSNGRSFQRLGQGTYIPLDLCEWFHSLPFKYETKSQVFVHAGLNPGWEINQQSNSDLIWIRELFLSSDHDFGKMVIHGHTPYLNGPEVTTFRINLDTGACFDGPLTAGLFDPNERMIRAFYQVTDDFKKKICLNKTDTKDKFNYVLEINENKIRNVI
jgi:serine/threonine protein phosphatase 1